MTNFPENCLSLDNKIATLRLHCILNLIQLLELHDVVCMTGLYMSPGMSSAPVCLQAAHMFSLQVVNWDTILIDLFASCLLGALCH